MRDAYQVALSKSLLGFANFQLNAPKYGSHASDPLVTPPHSDAPPIGGSPSVEAVKRLNEGMEKDGVFEGMIAEILANNDVKNDNWILASHIIKEELLKNFFVLKNC